VLSSRLYDLQQIDTALAHAVAYRSELNDGGPQRAIVAMTSDHLEELRRQITAAQGRVKALDLEIQSLQAKSTKIEADLYSGRIGNPKELAAMQDDVTALRHHTSHLEDEVLEVMERVESLETQRREAQEGLAAAEADLVSTVEAYRRAATAADRDIEALSARRRQVTAELDEDLVRRYDRLREKKDGVAVVAVRAGVCGGCHVTIPQRLLSRLERDRDLIAGCDGCGRFLIVTPHG
jgi:predicted  nucleic acid-binding Zn-ribbon protein